MAWLSSSQVEGAERECQSPECTARRSGGQQGQSWGIIHLSRGPWQSQGDSLTSGTLRCSQQAQGSHSVATLPSFEDLARTLQQNNWSPGQVQSILFIFMFVKWYIQQRKREKWWRSEKKNAPCDLAVMTLPHDREPPGVARQN